MGLAVGPDYKQPDMKTPEQYREIGAATRPTTRGTSQAQIQPDYVSWWTTLNDPILNGLIDRAAKNNPDVLAAEARIREAAGNPRHTGVGAVSGCRWRKADLRMSGKARICLDCPN